MAKPIGQNAILFLHQRRQQRLIGGIARDKQQRARITQPLRQLLFQRLMRSTKTGDVAGTAGPHAILLRTLLPGSDHLRILAQAQIVIAGKIQVALVVKLKMAAIAALIH
ncbi:hypothetical protein D3C80_815090 [compost metagenome]